MESNRDTAAHPVNKTKNNTNSSDYKSMDFDETNQSYIK